LPFSLTADGVRIRLRLTPKAGANRVRGSGQGADGARHLKVAVTTAPEGGKANKAAIRLLARAWHLPAGKIVLVSGHKDRNKVLLIEGGDRRLLAELRSWLDNSGSG